MKLRKAQAFLDSKNQLAAHLFFIEDEENPGIINAEVLDVLFPGLPQTPYFTDIESLVSTNRAIVYVHYYGSWYSGGDFTPITAAKSIRDALVAISSKQLLDVYTDKKITIQVTSISLIGNSFGGHFVYNADEQLKKILLAPLLAVSIDDVKESSSKYILSKIEQDIKSYKKSLPFCYRGMDDKLWDVFINSESSDRLKEVENILVYIGSKDPLITKEYVTDSLDGLCKDLIIREINCGHSFFELYQAYVEDSN